MLMLIILAIYGFLTIYFQLATWYNLPDLDWLLLRLYARKLALIAYRAEWNRVIHGGVYKHD